MQQARPAMVFQHVAVCKHLLGRIKEEGMMVAMVVALMSAHYRVLSEDSPSCLLFHL